MIIATVVTWPHVGLAAVIGISIVAFIYVITRSL